MNFKKIRPWLVALLGLLTLAVTADAAIPPAENLLPADTLFVLTVPDCTVLRQAAGQSPQWLLWNDPAMKPFHDKFMGKWNEQFMGPLMDDLGVSLSDFMDLPQGQFTFAVTRNGWDGQDDKQHPGLVLLLDAKDKSDQLSAMLAALQKKWLAAGKNIRTEMIHGLPFSVVPLSTNDIPAVVQQIFPSAQPVQVLGQNPAPARKIEMVFAQYQSLLIVGDSVQTLEPVVSRLTGGGVPCLADNPLFEADQASQFRDSPVYYSWFNAHGIFAVISQMPATQPNPNTISLLPSISPGAVLNASGLMGLKSISLSYRQSHDGTSLNVYLSVPEADRSGIFKMIATRPKDASPPVFVPADAVKFWRWRLDSQNIWAELQKTVGGIFPGALGTLNGVIDTANSLAQQKDPAFDVRKNLIGNLSDDWMSYEKGPASPDDLNRTRGIFLFAANNPEQAILAFKTVATLSASQDGAPAAQVFLGHTIHAVALRPEVSPSGATVQSFAYCAISSGYVAVSTDLSVLEEFLRNVAAPPRPLSDTPGLADAIEHIGGTGNGLFGYQDHRVVMRAAFASAKSGGAQITMPYLPKAFNDWIDCSLLPDYDQVSKYFYFSVFNGATTPDGIQFKGFYPRPPQLN